VVRADESEMSKLLVTVWDGLRDKHVVEALRARSFVDVTSATPMVFFTHYTLVTRPMIRTIMNVAQAFIEEDLAGLSVIGAKSAPLQDTIQSKVFVALRSKFDVTKLEAAYAAWWSEKGSAIGSAYTEATSRETNVSAHLSSAAPFMLATHLRNLDKDCMGISELEYAPITTDFVESGFAHLDLAIRTLGGASMDSCIGAAQAAAMKAFATDGDRHAAAMQSARKVGRDTGLKGAAAQTDEKVVAQKLESELTSFWSLAAQERWEIIRELQSRYKDNAKDNQAKLQAESSARLARLREKQEFLALVFGGGWTSTTTTPRSSCAGLPPPSTPSALTTAPTLRRARRRCATKSGCGCTLGGLSRRTFPTSATTRAASWWSA